MKQTIAEHRHDWKTRRDMLVALRRTAEMTLRHCDKADREQRFLNTQITTAIKRKMKAFDAETFMRRRYAGRLTRRQSGQSLETARNRRAA